MIRLLCSLEGRKLGVGVSDGWVWVTNKNGISPQFFFTGVCITSLIFWFF